MGGIFDSYNTLGIDLLKRASFGILWDLWGSLFLVKTTFSFPFAIWCKCSTEHCVQSTRTQLSLCFMERDNLQFMYKLEGKGYTEMGKRDQKNTVSLLGRPVQLCNSLVCLGALTLLGHKTSSLCVSTLMINSCSHWIRAFPEGHQSLRCLCQRRYEIEKQGGDGSQQQQSPALPRAPRSLPLSSAPARPAAWVGNRGRPAAAPRPASAAPPQRGKKEKNSCWRVEWRSREQKDRRGEQNLYFINSQYRFQAES